MDGRWKLAVGIHPKKVPNCTDSYLNQVKTMLHSNPLVVALMEVGLDRTVPDYLWEDQDRILKRVLAFSNKVLVLHLRGVSSLNCNDVQMTALHYVKKACLSEQKIHLHCLPVESLMEDIPNCYFFFFFFFFLIQFYSSFFTHIETNQSVGGAKTGVPGEKPPDTPASRTWLVPHVTRAPSEARTHSGEMIE